MTEQKLLQIVPSEILDGFYTSIDQGFYEYASEYSANAYKHDARTIPCIIHDHIVDAVRANVDDSRLEYRRSNQRNLFIFDNQVIFNIKKFDENLQSSNYPTKSARTFYNQGELEGIPSELPRVELGYIPDAIGAKILGVFAVKRKGKAVEWSVDLSDHDEPKQRDFKIA